MFESCPSGPVDPMEPTYISCAPQTFVLQSILRSAMIDSAFIVRSPNHNMQNIFVTQGPLGRNPFLLKVKSGVAS